MLFPPCAHLLWWYWRDASCIVFVNSARLGLHAPFCRIMSAEECGHHSIKQLPLLSLPFSLALTPGEADPAGSFICGWGKRHSIRCLRRIYHHLARLEEEAAGAVMDGGRRPILLRFLRVASSICGQKHGVISCSCAAQHSSDLLLLTLCKWPQSLKEFCLIRYWNCCPRVFGSGTGESLLLLPPLLQGYEYCSIRSGSHTA